MYACLLAFMVFTFTGLASLLTASSNTLVLTSLAASGNVFLSDAALTLTSGASLDAGALLLQTNTSKNLTINPKYSTRREIGVFFYSWVFFLFL